VAVEKKEILQMSYGPRGNEVRCKKDPKGTSAQKNKPAAEKGGPSGYLGVKSQTPRVHYHSKESVSGRFLSAEA